MAKQAHIRIREICAACGRLHTSGSRRGLWFTCKRCGTVNAGPGAKAPTPGVMPIKRRRRRQPEPVEPPPPPPAPKRSGLRRLLGGG